MTRSHTPVLRTCRPAALLAAVAISVTLATGCAVRSSPRAIAPTSMSISMPDVRTVSVDVQTVNGRIVITQDPSIADASVSAEARLTSSERAERFTIETVVDADGTLRIRPVWPDGERMDNEACNIEVTAPALSHVDARTSNGSVRLSGGKGRAVIKTSNGSVTIHDRQGSMHARTSNGRIEIKGGAGAVDVASSNGSITIEGTGPGEDDSAYVWRASTSNGSIRLDLPREATGRVRASTSNNTARVYRRATNGVQTELVSSRRMDYQIGPGGGEIVLSTSNGSILVVTP
ncbi:MAG: DUF4097 family beta strand repeat-containing protein [Phycisphaerales bacterium JB060]